MSCSPIKKFQPGAIPTDTLESPVKTITTLPAYTKRSSIAPASSKFAHFADKRLFYAQKKERKGQPSQNLYVFTSTHRTDTYWVVCPNGAVWRAIAWWVADCSDGETCIWNSVLTLWSAPRGSPMEEGLLVSAVYLLNALELPSTSNVGLRVPSLVKRGFEEGRLAPTNFWTTRRERPKLISRIYKEFPFGVARLVSDGLIRSWNSSPFTRTEPHDVVPFTPTNTPSAPRKASVLRRPVPPPALVKGAAEFFKKSKINKLK